jgi:hypothetical protein
MSNFLVVSERIKRVSRYVCNTCLKGELQRDVRVVKGTKMKTRKLPDVKNHFLVCDNPECKAEVGITPDFVYPIIEDFPAENRIIEPNRNLNQGDTLIDANGVIVRLFFLPNVVDYPDNNLEAIRHGRFVLCKEPSGEMLEMDILDDESRAWKKSDVRIRSEVVSATDNSTIPEVDEFKNDDPNMDLERTDQVDEDSMTIDLSLLPIDTDKFVVWNSQIYIKLKQETMYRRFDMEMRKVCANETGYIELFFMKKELDIYDFEESLKNIG